MPSVDLLAISRSARTSCTTSGWIACPPALKIWITYIPACIHALWIIRSLIKPTRWPNGIPDQTRPDQTLSKIHRGHQRTPWIHEIWQLVHISLLCCLSFVTDPLKRNKAFLTHCFDLKWSVSKHFQSPVSKHKTERFEHWIDLQIFLLVTAIFAM